MIIKTDTENKLFVPLMAFLMSLIALAIDAMLPALNQIKESLNIENANDVQLVISSVFFGMSFGLLLFGPLSDAYGRKKPLYFGILIFIIGSFVSLLSKDLDIMLFGRFLQGFGASSCRVISTAMIRDKFSGQEMGKVMSLIMMIFIIVPALAPSLGQLILFYSTWHSIFLTFIILAFIALLILWIRQEETLKLDKRIPISFKEIIRGSKETLTTTATRGYILSSGLIFGAFVGYLSSSQQILQNLYNAGDKFSLLFGCLAICIGISSFINSRLVDSYGMRELSIFSLIALCILSSVFLIYLFLSGGSTGLLQTMIYLGTSFLFIGILFGNLNTLAIEPLGHIAGMANSVISAVQTIISVGIGGYIGRLYNGTLYPLAGGFLILGILSIICIVLHSQKTLEKV